MYYEVFQVRYSRILCENRAYYNFPIDQTRIQYERKYSHWNSLSFCKRLLRSSFAYLTGQSYSRTNYVQRNDQVPAVVSGTRIHSRSIAAYSPHHAHRRWFDLKVVGCVMQRF